MVQEQWLQLKMFLLFLLGWIDFWWGGNKNSVGRWGGGMSRFSAGGGDSPHPPSMENLIYIYIYIYINYTYYTYYTYTYLKELCQEVIIYNEEALCTSHTSCAKMAILLLQELSTLYVSYICYMFSLVCSVFVIQ